MVFHSRSRLPHLCPFASCPSRLGGPAFSHLVRRGFFFRSSDSKWIARFLCRHCRHSFSQATFSASFNQKRRTLNDPVKWALVSGVSQRRAALNLGTNRKTIVRKFLWNAEQAEKRHTQFLKSLSAHGVPALQFDEMESFERSKCLPLSIPLVVQPKTRKILALDVCSMPAKGPLASLSFRKYGPRRDDRARTAVSLLAGLKGAISVENIEILSDQNPKYPGWIRKAWGNLSHVHNTVKGQRGCVVGQGELKRGGFDPLFSLNHTAAMIRANVNRMVRRTWCTTKRPDRLKAHLVLYADFHNHVLTPMPSGSPPKGTS